MAKIGLDFSGFEAMRKRLNQLGADTKSIAEEALLKTHEIVTAKAEQAVQPANLPAKGNYSTGRTEKSLQMTAKIQWKGSEGSVQVGFDIKKGGLPSIFMMYGSPRYMKVQPLYDAFFGDQVLGEIANAQKEIFYKALEKYE